MDGCRTCPPRGSTNSDQALRHRATIAGYRHPRCWRTPRTGRSSRIEGTSPTDDAVIKLLWLAIRDIEDKRARQRAKERATRQRPQSPRPACRWRHRPELETSPRRSRTGLPQPHRSYLTCPPIDQLTQKILTGSLNRRRPGHRQSINTPETKIKPTRQHRNLTSYP